MTKRPRNKPGRPPKPGSRPVDPATIDPRAVLAGIAGDIQSPASARVLACKALLRLAEDTETVDDGEADDLTKRAILNMRKRRDD